MQDSAPCLPPPGTASGTTHVLVDGSGAAVALVWSEAYEEPGWRIPDGKFGTSFSPVVMCNRGYHYVGLLTMPAEVERLRAENARLREALAVCISALTDLRIGTARYMNGSEIYGDFQSAVDYARAALEPTHE